jgi:hypothetical protein
MSRYSQVFFKISTQKNIHTLFYFRYVSRGGKREEEEEKYALE